MTQPRDSPISALTALLLWSALAMLTASLNSCAPKIVTASPIAPSTARIHAAASAVAATSGRVAVTASSLSSQTTAMGAQYISAVLAAERLRKAGVATQDDLDANARNWQAMQSRNSLLESAAKSLAIDTTGMHESAVAIDAEAATLETSAIASDAAVVTLQTTLAKSEADAAAWRKLKFVGWVALACVLLYLFARYCLPAVIQAAKPL